MPEERGFTVNRISWEGRWSPQARMIRYTSRLSDSAEVSPVV